MINALIQLDRQLFISINHLPHNLILDSFFAFLTGIGYAGMIWFIIGIVIFIWEEIKDKRTLFALILSGIFSLLLGEFGIKNLIRRLRPQFTVPSTIIPFDVSHSFSFPSGHATIAFAAAFILAKKHKKIAWVYYLLATLISFSRIYLGKHYPSDILAGMLLGLLIGYMSLAISTKLQSSAAKL